MMDENTVVILTLQLVGIFSIVAALLLYLLCKIRNTASCGGTYNIPNRTLVVTSADNAVGLQISIHFANQGFRVFAGLKDGAENNNSPSAKIIRSWQKHRESIKSEGNIIMLPLDVTREDLLQDSVDIIRTHLPAGEDGIWAIINTSGLVYRGLLDQQDIPHWDAMLKTNVVGVLRVVRKFQNFLRSVGGRIITLGAAEYVGTGLVAYIASRYAVEGASKALREELSPMGINVITIQPAGITPELLFSVPKMNGKEIHQETSFIEVNTYLDYQPRVLSSKALQTLDTALTKKNPKASYSLKERNWCRSSKLLKII